ncbi:MAG: GTPase domain-containing protein [Acidobacteriota bacterium]
MAFINEARREISCKLVYCGPGLSGKTTNIVQLYRSARPDHRGRLISLYSELERTLYFDFLPIDVGRIRGMNVRFHLYSVPGQVFHAPTRRLVLRGADGIVFVADSQRSRRDANLEALRDLREHLDYYGVDIAKLPYALQLNKRDLPDICDLDEMIAELRLCGEPVFQAIAAENLGVRETWREVAKQVLLQLEADWARGDGGENLAVVEWLDGTVRPGQVTLDS